VSIAIYEGDFDDLSGGVVCSWFISNPRGPTAFAVGFVEVGDKPWSLFYRRMHFTGAKTYLGGTVEKEISAASGNFFDAFFNHMIALNNYLALSSRETPEFLGEVPTFIRTNGNPDVDAAMRWLIADTADLLGTDWGQELYLCETYGAALAGPVGRELLHAHEGYRKQKQPAYSEALFARWWATVTDKAYIEPSAFQFAQAWVAADRAAKGRGQLNRSSSGGNRMSYSELAHFFDNFHMPLLRPEVDEPFLLRSLGLD
jgi:hypothetical protein